MIRKVLNLLFLLYTVQAFPRFAGPRWGSFVSNTPRIRDGYAGFNPNMLNCVSGTGRNRVRNLLKCLAGRKK